MEKSKRGEITTTQLVTIIVLIVSFAVILFFIFRLNLGETTDKEICHNSVVLRGQSKLSTGPLDCKTSYVCISGGGECEQITTTTTIEAKIRDGVMKALADEMSDCWFMFGEDKKIRYTGGLGSTGVHCAICSIVDFDENIQGQISSISYLEFYNYLSQTKKDDFQTYLKYLYGINEISSFQSQSQITTNIGEDIISTSEKYSIITGIDNNLVDFLDDDEWLNVYLIPTAETSSRTDCSEFITKA